MAIDITEATCPRLGGIADQMVANRRWAWSSGPRAALGHRLELLSEQWDWLRLALGPLLAPFMAHRARSQVHGTHRVVMRDNPAAPFALYYGRHRLTYSSRPEMVARTLAWHSNRLAIEHTVDSHLLLHAAAATAAESPSYSPLTRSVARRPPSPACGRATWTSAMRWTLTAGVRPAGPIGRWTLTAGVRPAGPIGRWAAHERAEQSHAATRQPVGARHHVAAGAPPHHRQPATRCGVIGLRPG